MTRPVPASGAVRPLQEGRVTVTDLPSTALGQLPGTDYESR